MKSFCASLILMTILYVTVETRDCSSNTVKDCIDQITRSHNLLNSGSVGDLKYSQQRINDICKANAETRRCYFDVLKPCDGKTNAVNAFVLREGDEVVNKKGDVRELCDTPKFHEGYGELAKCYKQHGEKVSADCEDKVSVEMGMIKEGETMKDWNVQSRVSKEDKASNKSTEEKQKSACCKANKITACGAEGFKEKCGDTMKEFFLNIPSATVDEQLQMCLAHEGLCAAAINLTSCFTLILTAIAAILLAK